MIFEFICPKDNKSEGGIVFLHDPESRTFWSVAVYTKQQLFQLIERFSPNGIDFQILMKIRSFNFAPSNKQQRQIPTQTAVELFKAHSSVSEDDDYQDDEILQLSATRQINICSAVVTNPLDESSIFLTTFYQDEFVFDLVYSWSSLEDAIAEYSEGWYSDGHLVRELRVGFEQIGLPETSINPPLIITGSVARRICFLSDEKVKGSRQVTDEAYLDMIKKSSLN